MGTLELVIWGKGRLMARGRKFSDFLCVCSNQSGPTKHQGDGCQGTEPIWVGIRSQVGLNCPEKEGLPRREMEGYSVLWK